MSDSGRAPSSAQSPAFLVGADEPVLITGARGFIGSRVVASLLSLGLRNLRCLVRPSGDPARLKALQESNQAGARVEVIAGNLLSRQDCADAVRGVAVVFHLAAGRGEKSIPDAFMNSAVTTRNLLEACAEAGTVRRFVNVSSFAVYTNRNKRHWRMLDESCPVEAHPELRGDAYLFAKAKQEQILREYGDKLAIPYVIVRPGYVYGPGNPGITGRVGISSFGLFLHLGGSNPIPFSYVDNCADAIALAGLKPGLDGEVFNIVDDDLPSSRRFLRLYKKNVRRFRSLYLPHIVSYSLCYLWERYSDWSQGQLPPAFNRRLWYASWKKTGYSNQKLKNQTGWAPRVPMAEGLQRYFTACRNGGKGA